MATLLLADPDPAVRRALGRILQSDGHEVVAAADANEALASYERVRPGLVLLEFELPPLGGLDVCERIRQTTSQIPIVFVSARGDDLDVVTALRAGADDYIIKPFSVAQLQARVAALLRRSAERTPRGSVYEDRVLRIDRGRVEVRVRGEIVSLSPLEYRLLNCLVERAGRAIAPEELATCAWPDGTASAQNVKIYIGYLRRKVEQDPTRPRLIQTVRGVGYRYERRVDERA